MEDRRPVIVILLLIVGCVILAVPVQGYNNLNAHPMINKYAVLSFEREIKPNDAYLKTASLDGAYAVGYDWNLSDGRRGVPSEGIISRYREKALKSWIIDGGFSQDEPEKWQSLRHFYDPINARDAYLTDSKILRLIGSGYYGAEMYNPQINALDWAFDSSKRNEYSYPKAKEYFKSALASEDRKTENYGRAWRSVGETMHMMADMATPAHVRNDGHPISDPYEDSVIGSVVENISRSGESPANLNYNVAPRTLMDKLALFTNRNFFSADTIISSYPQPDLSQSPADNGYIMGTINGQPYHVVKITSLMEDLYSSPRSSVLPHMDLLVIQDQQKILIPTAVRAGAAVLDRFLPRFVVTGDITTTMETKNGEPVPIYYLNGKIDLVGNKEEWPEKLTIRNGANLVNAKSGKRFVIPVNGVVSGDNLNSFTYLFVPEVDVGANPGDKVFLEYDLGGYVIRSPDITIPEPEKTPPALNNTGKTPQYEDDIDSRCILYSQYGGYGSTFGEGPNARPGICDYLANHAVNSQKEMYSPEQFQICGCCRYSSNPEIYSSFNWGESNEKVRSYLTKTCGNAPDIAVTPTVQKTTMVTTLITPTPRPTACLNQGVSNRDCECLCRCYKDAAAHADCSKACSGGYAFSACSYG
jgi:hypothetical protein